MVYLSDSKREILERRKTVILHYMQYEADIRAKKLLLLVQCVRLQLKLI